jgi:predicted  nucleic acid-binding Zn-ribbon protein
MGDWEIECTECGWRGMRADADHAADKPGEESVKCCPDCGSPEFLNRAEEDETENS